MGLGTGKTRVAVTLLDRWEARVALVVCPLSVIPTWMAEVEKYSDRPWRTVNLHKGASRLKTAKAALVSAKHHDQPVLLVLNYESVYRDPLGSFLIKEAGLDVLVIDESHRLKSPRGVQSKYVYKLSQVVPRRLALTGTPMPAGPMDIFAQMRFIEPRLFGSSFFRFRARYAKMGGFGGHEVIGYKQVPELQNKLASVTFQASRDVLDLPEATHTEIRCELGREGRKIYNDLAQALRAELEEGEITAANGLVKLLRLQQLTGGTAVVDEVGEVRVDEAKAKALEDLLDNVEPNEPFVVFAQFRADLAAIHRAAANLGRRSLELSGGANDLQAWKDGAAPILAVQIHSGGTGVDLTRSRYCAYYSTGFNLGDYEQSLARVHRPGQGRSVHYYHLVTNETVDDQVYGALRSKKRVVDAILNHLKENYDA
tara:strand:- start:670 stop:1950 length:1281 start_codon:yes stop_codon:yes gene_type:complete